MHTTYSTRRTSPLDVSPLGFSVRPPHPRSGGGPLSSRSSPPLAFRWLGNGCGARPPLLAYSQIFFIFPLKLASKPFIRFYILYIKSLKKIKANTQRQREREDWIQQKRNASDGAGTWWALAPWLVRARDSHGAPAQGLRTCHRQICAARVFACARGRTRSFHAVCVEKGMRGAGRACIGV